MESTCIQLLTIAPIYIPVELKTGVDRESIQYRAFQEKIHQQFEQFLMPLQALTVTEYESIETDSWDHKLFSWRDPTNAPGLVIHVFPNNVAVGLFEQTAPYTAEVKQIERDAQDAMLAQIALIYPQFLQTITEISSKQYGDFLHLDKSASPNPDVHWVSRAILLESSDLVKQDTQALIKPWLKHTFRPEDAEDIVSRTKTFSLTWLNYVIVDLKDISDERLDAMVLAQYYYAAQEQCNKALKQAIDVAYNGNQKNEAEKKLNRSRVTSRLHLVAFHEHLNYITRNKRTILEDILDCWQFDKLTENGRRMIEVCSSRLEEAENKKREKSSLLTDLLLVALSFFTVFELSLYLSQLSREMMSRPTLDYNDDSRSFLLAYIAEIDTDVMFGSGFFLTLLLVFIYKIIKSR